MYKISCKSCDAFYIGQTGRKLKTRLAKHRNHINRNSNNQLVITKHRIEFEHDFDWMNAILDEERFLNKCLISKPSYTHTTKVVSIYAQIQRVYINLIYNY